MQYKELTEHAHNKFGNELNYGMLGRISKTYKLGFIASCISQYPEEKMKLNPNQRMMYLIGMCKGKATDNDYAGKPVEFN